MQVLVIPDIHLKTWIFDCAEELLRAGKADMAVCLMDIPDDWGMESRLDLYNAIYDRAIAFAKDFPNTLWCYGNHDKSYQWNKKETGFSEIAQPTILRRQLEFQEALASPSNLAIVQRVDNILFSHGGLIREYIEWLGKDLLDADIDKVLREVNCAGEKWHWNNASPLWFRGTDYTCETFRGKEYMQVVGHTPVKKITRYKNMIYTDAFSTRRDGSQIGESKMIVIDSKTKKYKSIKIPKKHVQK